MFLLIVAVMFLLVLSSLLLLRPPQMLSLLPLRMALSPLLPFSSYFHQCHCFCPISATIQKNRIVVAFTPQLIAVFGGCNRMGGCWFVSKCGIKREHECQQYNFWHKGTQMKKTIIEQQWCFRSRWAPNNGVKLPKELVMVIHVGSWMETF